MSCVGETTSRSPWGRNGGCSHTVRKVEPVLPLSAWYPSYLHHPRNNCLNYLDGSALAVMNGTVGDLRRGIGEGAPVGRKLRQEGNIRVAEIPE